MSWSKGRARHLDYEEMSPGKSFGEMGFVSTKVIAAETIKRFHGPP